jgi:hypothetical protein
MVELHQVGSIKGLLIKLCGGRDGHLGDLDPCAFMTRRWISLNMQPNTHPTF